MTETPVTGDDVSPSCVFRYEVLRSGALGQPVAPEHRSGLVVLLRRGLWTWFRAVTYDPDTRRRPGVPQAGFAPGELVHLLADLTHISPREAR